MEMEPLFKLCGKKNDSWLNTIAYSSGNALEFKRSRFLFNALSIDMIFSNGCRAPPWRQVHGDICYIRVLTHEKKQFLITASTEGYYINKVFFSPLYLCL